MRAEEIGSARGNWPCRKGCSDCCRQLASAPRVTEEEWRPIADAIEALATEIAEEVRKLIRESKARPRPVVCPLLDSVSGTCLVYEARPVACRAYGFYAERQYVLGCSRIESVAQESPEVVWGNHLALEERVERLGPAAELAAWLDSGGGSRFSEGDGLK
jgi:Fe-S-cluster containining protein